MTNINRLVLAGRLTRDPEVRFTSTGTALMKVGVAVNERRKNASGEWVEDAIFCDVLMFGKRAEAFANYHCKGSECCFPDAKLAYDTWEDKVTGEGRNRLYVIANTWEFIGAKPEPPVDTGIPF